MCSNDTAPPATASGGAAGASAISGGTSSSANSFSVLTSASRASRKTKPSAFSGRQIWMMKLFTSTRSPTVISPRAVCSAASSITAATPAAMIALCPMCRPDSARWLATLPSTHCVSTPA